MAFFKDVSFRNARTDLIGFLRNTGKYSPWLFLAACMPTAIIIYTFYIDAMVKAMNQSPAKTKNGLQLSTA